MVVNMAISLSAQVVELDIHPRLHKGIVQLEIKEKFKKFNEIVNEKTYVE